MRKISYTILIYLSLWACDSFAQKVNAKIWNQTQSSDLAEYQMLRFNEALGVSSKNHLRFSHLLVFNPETSVLELSNSDLFGYPYAQSLGLGFLTDDRFANFKFGFSYYFDRTGWENADFLIFPEKSSWSLDYQSHQTAFLTSYSPLEAFLAIGWRHSRSTWRRLDGRIESHQDNAWVLAKSYMFSAGMEMNKEVQSTLFEMDLRRRVERNSWLPRWAEFLPIVTYYTPWDEGEPDLENSFLQVNQKLWSRYFYTRQWFSNQWEASFLDVFLDKTHFFSFHLNIYNSKRGLQYGGKTNLGPVSMGYNDAETFRRLSGLEGVFFVELGLNISTLEGLLYQKPGALSPSKGDIGGVISEN